MSYRLVVTEKPSVAQSIAKVLKVRNRKEGYLEGNGYFITWCVGHLVGLADAKEYNEKYEKWDLKDLPILPDPWKQAVNPGKLKQFHTVKALMSRPDVDVIICATDAGREGELIFRNVYHYAGCRIPFVRLWISSMEDSAISEGFHSLQPSQNYDALYQSALARSHAELVSRHKCHPPLYLPLSYPSSYWPGADPRIGNADRSGRTDRAFSENALLECTSYSGRSYRPP